MSVRPLAAAIAAVPYASAVKVGLQFKRRFWEEDEQIYGGITYTDLPIANIGYPNTGFHSGGKGVLLGAYIWGSNAMEFTAMTPEERVRKAVEYGSQIHPQYHAGIRQRRRRGLASLAVHHGLLRHVDRRDARQALRRSVRHRRPHRAGGRTRLLSSAAGRKARSRRRSMPSADCISVPSRHRRGWSNGMRSPPSRAGTLRVAALLWSAGCGCRRVGRQPR